jgi:hypothetical protein
LLSSSFAIFHIIYGLHCISTLFRPIITSA